MAGNRIAQLLDERAYSDYTPIIIEKKNEVVRNILASCDEHRWGR
jgi:hypothetical protein